MQLTSKEFDKAIRRLDRSWGYVKVSIGVINSEAQKNAQIRNTELTYFSDGENPFDEYPVDRVYATAEQDFSKVDGSMYFLPKESSGMSYYNNGIVTNEILGSVRIWFGGLTGFDIKGLTIDFGEYYPTKFTIESDSGIRSYENDKRLFVTEDVFAGTSYFTIAPSEMVNGKGRLRIYRFSCGIVNTFSNEKVKRCSTKEYVSPVSETIPSMDTTIVIDNQDLYYSVDNPESAIAYMEVGQEVKVSFGYDVTGDGDVEWLSETTTYLNNWRANDLEAEFTSTDRFYQLDEMYYGGLYRSNGITLYKLAIDVLNSAGIMDDRYYYIDSYLKKIIVYNPIPPVKHSEALQIIANAGRCILYEDRKNRIHLKSSFVPDMTASDNGRMNYSSIDKLLKDYKKKAYAEFSNDYTTVDGTMFFMPKNAKDFYKDTGYVSESVYEITPKGTVSRRLSFRFGANQKFLAEGVGTWTHGEPVITVNLESVFTAFGIIINFRNVAPEQFVIKTYREGVAEKEFVVNNPELEYITDERFYDFDKMEITFTKGYPNSRVFIDNILIGDVTNYTIERNDLTASPIGERQKRIKNISIPRTNYRKAQEESKELLSEQIKTSNLTENAEYTAYFSIASYGYSAKIKDNTKVSATIIDSSDFYVRIRFNGITNESSINLSIEGYEYVADETYYKKQHHVRGQEITWRNPLISTTEHARDLEEWLSTYYLGDVDYEISWRGDPRVEANDLFYLELKDREKALIRSYENELEFDGAWSGRMKARKVMMSWQ